MKDSNQSNQLTTALFVVYLIALFWIIVLKLSVSFSYMGKRSINLIPYSEPLILNGRVDFGEMILNVLIFVPLGMYAGILFRRWTVGKIILLFFFISLLCEAFQFILAVGAFDITDIINNTLGGIIGLVIYKGTEKAFHNSVKAQKVINIIALAGTILMMVLLFLLKANMLPVKYQ